jgi:TolB-like protein/Tfp pilus assembly protein PilF
MSDSVHRAVFLSYAREDTDAARRIADALRAFGVEVWFDQSELRGGDAWDQNIRRQIKECALFLPIISQHTQERGEGYFRLEWKLAAERTHLMAEGRPFVVPLVVDDAREAEALVPPEFMRVQWTRLPQGVPSPQFVGQVQRLLAAPGTDVGRGLPTPPPSRAHPIPAGSGDPALQPKRSSANWFSIVLGAALLALAGYVALRPSAKEPAAPPRPTAEAKPAPVAPRADPKSLAVLPFANMSEEKNSAFFADGVHEDILTHLALIRELKVVSRTTVVQYRDSKKSLRQIGEELGVAYILEGSVRRVGNKVRVTGQLINARTDEHVWAKSYDRDLTDIFAIQAALATEIAGALETALTPQTQQFLERRPTENPVAYDSYLKGRDSRNRDRNTRTGLQKQEALYQFAVQQDPKFAAAWGELAVVHALNVFWEYDHSPARLAQADAAIGQAVRLAPESPDVIRTLGTYAYYAYRDYARAIEQYEKLARMQPNDPTVFSSLGLIQRRQGHWTESLSNLWKAYQLEQANASYARNLVASLEAIRRYGEAISVQRRLAAMLPDQLADLFTLHRLLFEATGSWKETDDWMAQLSPEELSSPRVISRRRGYAYRIGDMAEFKRLDQLQPFFDGDGTPHMDQALGVALGYFARGDVASAQARLGNFPTEVQAELQREPANLRLWSIMSSMELVLGQKEAALTHARKAAELLPESLDDFDGPRYNERLANMLLWTGNKEGALAEYKRLLSRPGYINVHYLRTEPGYAPLRDDPRFQALINDPKNNQPLF